MSLREIAMGADLPPLRPDAVIEAYKRDLDRTLLRENLKLSVEERFRKHMDFGRFADELRRAGVEFSRRVHAAQFPAWTPGLNLESKP